MRRHLPRWSPLRVVVSCLEELFVREGFGFSAWNGGVSLWMARLFLTQKWT